MISAADVHRALRDETAPQHISVEAHPCFAALMSASVTEKDVLRALSIFHAHHAVWEPCMAQALGGKLPERDLARRWRLPALRADMRRFGLAAQQMPSQSKAGPLPFQEALGWLYVHEGARHGALVIRKHLTKHLGGPCAQKFSYLAGYGAQTAAMWSETLDLLDAHIHTVDHLDRAVFGAQSAFAQLELAAAAHTQLARAQADTQVATTC